MKMTRRNLLGTAALSWLGSPLLAGAMAGAVSGAALPNPKMRLGIVTYNIAKDWTLETIIKNCEATGFEGVELRTTHAHGVEVSLNASQRADVKNRFQNSKVVLMGLGSAFDYHTPDPAKLRADIEATRQYIL